MANYPKPRTKEKMVDGKWKQTTDIRGLPNTTKYTRWYSSNYKVDLYHKRESDIYTYFIIRMKRNGTSSFKEFHFNATTLQRAQEHVDLIMKELMTE